MNPQLSGMKADTTKLLTRCVQVAVIGGGPAGTSTALALAQAGVKVAVLERSRYATPRVGESLPPQVCGLLAKLGVWERFLADQHLQAPGIVSVWGSSELYENDFIVNPYGCGWHVDRRRFDQMLAVTAEEAGADVHLATQVTACTRQPSGGWLISAVCDGQPSEFYADFLVEAAGRTSALTSREERSRIVYDRLVAVIQTMQVSSSTRDHRLLLEACSQGWWYSAALPNDQQIVAYLTDADLIPRNQEQLICVWRELLRAAPHTQARAAAGKQSSALRIVAANSSRRRTIAGVNYLAVGDVAMAVDPLSSQGMSRALESGLHAARAILDHRSGHSSALTEYAASLEKSFADYLQARSEYYLREQRWTKSPFWQRRHAPASISLAPDRLAARSG